MTSEARSRPESPGVIDPLLAAARLPRPFEPETLATLNGQAIRVIVTEGAFAPHRHDQSDELFYVLEGEIELEIEGERQHLGRGQMMVVPRGLAHRTITAGRARLLLIQAIDFDTRSA
ncbi:MAG: cupin domain-containing protein [Planctomycetes bacterium]|nr:cupin domain-containing protein [Planctomycetota bacterium]